MRCDCWIGIRSKPSIALSLLYEEIIAHRLDRPGLKLQPKLVCATSCTLTRHYYGAIVLDRGRMLVLPLYPKPVGAFAFIVRYSIADHDSLSLDF